MAALAARGMITQSSKPTMFGQMRTVTLTKAGRAAVRASTTLTPRRAPRPTLNERSWEVLAILWSADVAGKPLDWGSSTTIDRILIEKRDQRLAQHGRGGYTLTDAGRSYYRERYPTYTVAYPDVRAPHPDGPRAEPWPARADQILVGHHRRYHALATAWRTVHDEHETAVAETTAAATPPPAGLPDDIAEQFAARHQLRCETAAQRAGLAAAHLGDLAYRCERAAQTYATAAIDAFAATTPPSELADPAPVDADIGQPLPSLPPTGIFAIDDAAAKLHAAAAGRPRRRRGPAPKKTGLAAATRAPGTDLADLATFLRRHTDGGALRRRLHPDTSSAPTQTTDSGPDDLDARKRIGSGGRVEGRGRNRQSARREAPPQVTLNGWRIDQKSPLVTSTSTKARLFTSRSVSSTFCPVRARSSSISRASTRQSPTPS
ncbi:hypothetical protein [Nocardia fluminea]|uniref:hypothetical protein n=1 Tax=Nocardia fluminea TaxID=134984 RepID=UPI0036521C15